MTRFVIGDTDFLLDGAPHRILSGALHYFRVHPGQWRDRIRKARLMGLNTIETYVAWNEHSPVPGRFDATGRLDLVRFLELVQEEGMHAIVRPGPYICAEWDGGGLPAWLFLEAGVGVRRREPRYMAAVEEYLRAVFALVAPLQIDRGGPVVLVQIENEYGAYGGDADYLTELVRITRDAGIEVPLTTIDQPTDEMLRRGSIPGLHRTGSFGSRAVERLATLRAHQPTGPLMCAEFWNGWFDHWGAHHHTTSADDSAAELDALLATGASVNLYMFHGGTNAGFTSGANDKGAYQPTVTSYDYDAPLDERGAPTPKYRAFRDVIAKYAPVPEDSPADAPDAPVLDEFCTGAVDLLALVPALGDAVRTTEVPTMDAIGQYRGYAVHRTTLDGAGEGPAVLDLGEVRDTATVLLDGVRVAVLRRSLHESRAVLPSRRGELVVLIEDQGRVNYGDRLGEPKGLIGGVRLDGEPVTDWSSTGLDLDRLDIALASARLLAPPAAGPVAGPVVLVGELRLEEPVDLFLDTAHLGKGVAFANGEALGRYWRAGPQRTLYIPAGALRAGANRIVLVETESVAEAVLRTLARPDLGHTDS